MVKINLSILLPTLNEEKNIKYALESVKWANEIFIIDSFSTDKTLEIAKNYSNVKIFQHPFENYSKQKNWALDNLFFSNDWIFILDADEQVTPELQKELIAFVFSGKKDVFGYYINRKFIFMGRWLKHCGWYPSWNLRLFQKGKARYEERAVHEHMMVQDANVGFFKNDLLHYDRRGLEAFIHRHNRYSTWEAREIYHVWYGHKKGNLESASCCGQITFRRVLKERVWYKVPARSWLKFIYMYFWSRGFLDGVPGFIFCVLQAIQEFHINLKLKELRQNISKSMVRDYWDKNPCGAKNCPYKLGTQEFFQWTRRRREALEPFIDACAQFDQWANKKVLEIGCGLGVDSLKFARGRAQLTAIDLSQQAVALTKQRLMQADLTAEVVTADAEKLGLVDNQFDFVYSWGGLHHTSDLMSAIDEVERVLKPGGKLCIMLYHRKSLLALKAYLGYGLLRFRPWRSVDAILAQHLESPGTKAFTADQVRHIFKRFSNVEIKHFLTPYDTRLFGEVYLPQWLKRLIPQKLGWFLVAQGQKPILKSC